MIRVNGEKASLGDNAGCHGRGEDRAYAIAREGVRLGGNIDRVGSLNGKEAGGSILGLARNGKVCRDERVGAPIQKPGRQSVVLAEGEQVPIAHPLRVDVLAGLAFEVCKQDPLDRQVIAFAVPADLRNESTVSASATPRKIQVDC